MSRIDWLFGEIDLCFFCDWDVSDAIVETGESICWLNWLTIGDVLAATSAAVLGLINVAFAKRTCPLWASLGCSDSFKCADRTPMGDVNELNEKFIFFNFWLIDRIYKT